MIHKLLIYPNHFLRKSTDSLETTYFNDREKYEKILDELRENLRYYDDGVALAANQIGIPFNAFVLNKDNEELKNIVNKFGDIFLDATYENLTDEKETKIEGCLSFPGVKIPVQRWKKIKVKARDKTFGKIELELENFPARVAQHEIDHCKSRLFIDDLPLGKRLKIGKQLSNFEKNKVSI